MADKPEIDRFRYLWEEYKLLQDKLDKIGGFKFQVRSWSAALATGLIAAFATNKIVGWRLLFSLPIVALFWLSEEDQRIVEKAIINRLDEVELFLRASAPMSFFALRSGRGRKAARPSSLRDALSQQKRALPDYKRDFDLGHLFYCTLAIAIAIAAIVSWSGSSPTGSVQ